MEFTETNGKRKLYLVMYGSKSYSNKKDDPEWRVSTVTYSKEIATLRLQLAQLESRILSHVLVEIDEPELKAETI